MMSAAIYKTGDHIRHAKRPEWGKGVVEKVELIDVEGRPAQRLIVKFEHQPRATLNTAYAQILPAGDYAFAAPAAEAAPEKPVGWLTALENSRVPVEALGDLPPACLDPLVSSGRRLEATLDLYRYEGHGRGLIEWAIAQTGLVDPFTKYSRNDLELAYQGFENRRDAHLRTFLGAMKKAADKAGITQLENHKNPRVRQAVRKLLDRM